MCLFSWLIDVDGDLALIDPTEPFPREEFGQDQREDSKENPRPTLKLEVPIPSPSLPSQY